MISKRKPRPGVSTVAELRDKIRAAGLRSTASRLVVLRHLEQVNKPMSHAELTEALIDEGLDRVTVFRNLNDLANAGLVIRTDLGDHTWRFEIRRPGAHGAHGGTHPHFTCTDCGTVSCLPENAVRLSVQRGMPKSISARAVEVTVRGRCDSCA